MSGWNRSWRAANRRSHRSILHHTAVAGYSHGEHVLFAARQSSAFRKALQPRSTMRSTAAWPLSATFISRSRADGTTSVRIRTTSRTRFGPRRPAGPGQTARLFRSNESSGSGKPRLTGWSEGMRGMGSCPLVNGALWLVRIAGAALCSTAR